MRSQFQDILKTHHRTKHDGDTDLFITPAWLAPLKWNKRVLLLAVPDLNSILDGEPQSREDILDRDLVLINLQTGHTFPELNAEISMPHPPLKEAIHLQSHNCLALLIGKDGTPKQAYGPAPPSLQEIFALIDTMPMRRQEMNQEGSPNDA